MTCALIDLGCHMQSAFWSLINLVPWWAWLAIAVAGIGAAYRFGGWPAVAALAFGYGVLWGSRRGPTKPERGEKSDPWHKPRGARRYNPDTNAWE